MIVTFYSYKGGVGRTMAMANIACLLSQRRKRVLVVDFDLEAPGLLQYFNRFRPGLENETGLMDLLMAAYARKSRNVDWRPYVTELRVQSSTLSLISSGRISESYSASVLNFDWTSFFRTANGGDFIERMRNEWKRDYDFVLIDSRTGITDIGGVCTIMLPDLIVPVFVPNHQSIEGVVDVIGRAQARRKKLAYDRPRTAILPVLSRFDSRTEFESGQEWLDIAAEHVAEFYGDWLPTEFTPRDALQRTKLPYVAYFSFGETLPVLTYGTAEPDSLGYALNLVAQLIEGQLANAPAIIGGGYHLGASDRGSSRTAEPQPQAASYEGSRTSAALSFRDRAEELDRVLSGVASPAGPHFWLVTAPPRLGKSWFLRAISEQAPSNWGVTLLDLRAEAMGLRADPTRLAQRLLGITTSITDDPAVLVRVAREISAKRRPLLCLLDSAELLTESTTVVLRRWLSEIYRHIESADASDVRLALVVASRSENRWRGISPAPRLMTFSLAEFNSLVVHQALTDLAEEMGMDPSLLDLRSLTTQVYDVTEGLPNLLHDCLNWIRAEQWLGLDRLAGQEFFDQFVRPYIRYQLLTSSSSPEPLHGWSESTANAQSESSSRVLEFAFHYLSRYRFFTQSHLRYHLERDLAFREAVDGIGWSLTDLWNEVSYASLLLQPLDEPWQEIYPAIRRLLFRYSYRSSRMRTRAHEEALKFVQVWGERQFGKEQTVSLVECLWHQGSALDLSDTADFEIKMIELAATLSRQLKPSPLYSIEELRHYAAERIGYDGELEAMLNRVEGLVARLSAIVIRPPELESRRG
jgi:MinD-like ATPase involved in chromosome partitioning or flagellar assembly